LSEKEKEKRVFQGIRTDAPRDPGKPIEEIKTSAPPDPKIKKPDAKKATD
jgi:hypothetical protein